MGLSSSMRASRADPAALLGADFFHAGASAETNLLRPRFVEQQPRARSFQALCACLAFDLEALDLACSMTQVAVLLIILAP